AVRAGLLAVAPDFDVIAVVGQRDLAADGRRRFFTAAIVSPERAKNVVKADRPRVETKVFGVVAADALHVELLPTVTVFRVRRVSLFFLERRDVGVLLTIARID